MLSDDGLAKGLMGSKTMGSLRNQKIATSSSIVLLLEDGRFQSSRYEVGLGRRSLAISGTSGLSS